jgi:cytochrome P450
MPELFPRPQEFSPQRWETIRPTPFEYSPFSTGPRTCIGAMFATIEMKIVLATILRQRRIEMVTQKVDRFAEMVLAPHGGLRFMVRRSDKNHRASVARFSGNVHDMVEFPASSHA